MKKETKKKKINIDKKELIITITVIVLALILGIFLGKELFDAFQARIQINQTNLWSDFFIVKTLYIYNKERKDKKTANFSKNRGHIKILTKTVTKCIKTLDFNIKLLYNL